MHTPINASILARTCTRTVRLGSEFAQRAQRIASQRQSLWEFIRTLSTLRIFNVLQRNDSRIERRAENDAGSFKCQ